MNGRKSTIWNLQNGGRASRITAMQNSKNRGKPWYIKAEAKYQELKAAEGLTYEKLGEDLGVSKGAVGHWLTGRREPDFAMIQKIAKRLGMGLSEMVGEDLYFVRDPRSRALLEWFDAKSEEDQESALKLLGISVPEPEITENK